ncbi:PPP1R14B (predicted) [Pycnogonum litorale]
MECGSLTANANPSSPYTASSSQSSQSSVTMGSKRNSGTNKVGLHVNFDTDKDELQERKKKYLTAKYGQHQMSLIKKRLGVEMWMYERLQYLYGSDDVQCYNDLDLDELLDVDGDFNKKNWLMDKLTETKQSQDEVNKFVDELLERAKIL